MMQAARAVLNSLQEGRAFHAYLLLGPQGSGKEGYAQKMISALLGKSENHPDLISVKPEKGLISVDQIREIKGILSTKAVQADFRVIVIEQANLMNERAQNAFLKTLEEPEAAVFILLSNTETGILPTVRSRCMLLKIPALSREEVTEKLITLGVHQDRAALCASISRGSYEEAYQWATDEALFALRLSTIEGLRRLFSKKADDKAAFGDLIKANKENIQLMLGVMLSIFRDMALDDCIGRINLDCIQLCDKGNRNLSKKKITGVIERLLRARREFASSVNFALAVDALLIDLTEDID